MNDYIEQEIEKHAQDTPGGLDARQKRILRGMLEKEEAFWEREQRDYVYGHDEGEPPMGEKW